MTAAASAETLLNAKFTELNERMTRLQRDRSRSQEPLEADFAEQAVQRENDEVLDRLAAATAEELTQIRHAIHRLADGQYGVCERCGESISAERLQVVPEATLCMRCLGA